MFAEGEGHVPYQHTPCPVTGQLGEQRLCSVSDDDDAAPELPIMPSEALIETVLIWVFHCSALDPFSCFP